MSAPTASTAGDTSFRKKYNPEEYASKTDTRTEAQKTEARERWEAHEAGIKYYQKPTGSESLARARDQVTDFSSRIGTTSIVTVDANGRNIAGFRCELCRFTARDSASYLEHERTAQHMLNTGQTLEVEAASAEDVRRRVDEVWARVQAAKSEEVLGLEERLALQKVKDEEEAERKRVKRKEANEKRKREQEEVLRAKMGYGEDVRDLAEHDYDDMMETMGIAGFGSSKK